MSAVKCPSWCSGEHAFVDEHDGIGHGSDDRVCILAGADFGREDRPTILVMLGDPGPDGMSARIKPNEARSLLECLRDPATVADIVAALDAVVAEVGG